MPTIDTIETILAATENPLTGITHSPTTGGTFDIFNVPGLWDIAANDQSYWQQSLPDGSRQEGCFRGTFHDKVLLQIPQLIGSARRIIDLTALELPTGEFQQAIADGLRLFQANAPSGVRPMVRIIIGITTLDRIEFHTMAWLKSWFAKTLQLAGIKPEDFIADTYLAISFDHVKHWNHAKILAADDQAMIGGINFWQDDYLRFAPVHDVSAFVSGPPVTAAHRFCTQLWTDTLFQNASFINGVEGTTLPPPPALPTSASTGTTRSLALGRLSDGDGGITLANNASVTARIIAVSQAKAQVRMAQQTLGGGPHIEELDTVLCALIAKSMIDGIDFEIVVSNDKTDGYDGAAAYAVSNLTRWVQTLLLQPDTVPNRNDPAAWAALTVKSFAMPDIGDPALAHIMPQANGIVVRHLQLCRLAFSPESIVRDAQGNVTGAQWENGEKTMPARNHAKIYIIDNDCFYFGSDNAYRSGTAQGLIEFGYLIEDAALLRQFITNYWQKLWANSQKCRVLLSPSV